MKATAFLPAFCLAIFDGEDDGNNSGAQGGTQNDGSQSGASGSQNNGGSQGGAVNGGSSSTNNGSQHGTRTEGQRQDGNGTRQDGDHNDRLRGEGGRYESRDEYEQRIRNLNEENATRRRENRELKTTLDVVQRRAMRADVLDAVRAANPFSENAATRIADMFMADMGDEIKLDAKTGQTVGLDKLAAWKKSNPDFFKADAQNDGGSGEGGNANDGKNGSAAGGNGSNDGGQQNGGAQSGETKRGNATSAGTSQGSNAGTGANSDGLPDLSKLKTPAERKAAVEAWKRGLNGAGASGGYGRASGKR